LTTFVWNGPQRVEIRAALNVPGLVVLADALDPGWHLAINGSPAPIWRTNRSMRGAIMSAGGHGLVYTYRSEALRVGGGVTIAGLVVLGGLVIRAATTRAPRAPSERSQDG
jgi:hypothetical protein